MNDRALELKVGLVLLAAIGILAAFLLFLGDFSFKSGIVLNVDYNFSGSIQESAPVKISGVKVGRVKELVFMGGKLNEKGEAIHVRLVLSIEERARPVLRQNTEFFVNTQGLLGENYVEIVPHPGESPPLESGSTVRGVDPARFDLLFARLYEFLESVSGLMKENRGVFVDLFRSGAGLAHTLDATLQANQADLGRAIKGAANATEGVTELVTSIRKVLGDGKKLSATTDDLAAVMAALRRDLPESLAKLRAALDDVHRLGDALGGVDRKRVDEIVQRDSAALADAQAILEDTRAIAKRVRGGQGTIGLLVRDDEIYDDLKDLLRDLKQHPWKLIWKD